MRKLILLAVAFLLLAAPAFAATSDDVDVTVTVPSIFGFNITAGDPLAFAEITDPFTSGNEVLGLTYDLDCNDSSGWVVNADFDTTTWSTTLDLQVYDYDTGPGYVTMTPDGAAVQFDSGGMESYDDGNWNFKLVWTAPVPNANYVGVVNIIMS